MFLFLRYINNKAPDNVANIRKRYYAEVKLNEVGVIGQGNNTNKSCYEIIDENTIYPTFGF